MPSAPETQFRERTRLARQRSALAFVLIAALLIAHAHHWIDVAPALLVVAAGLRAETPRALAATTAFAAAAGVLVVST